MRPMVVLAVTVAAAVAWFALRQLSPGWESLLLFFEVAVSLVPAAMVLRLLGRKRLGRWTSIWFVTQAAALVLTALLMPDGAYPDALQSPLTALLGAATMSNGLLGVLWVSGMTLGTMWLVLVPVTAMYAWRIEREPAPTT